MEETKYTQLTFSFYFVSDRSGQGIYIPTFVVTINKQVKDDLLIHKKARGKGHDCLTGKWNPPNKLFYKNIQLAFPLFYWYK